MSDVRVRTYFSKSEVSSAQNVYRSILCKGMVFILTIMKGLEVYCVGKMRNFFNIKTGGTFQVVSAGLTHNDNILTYYHTLRGTPWRCWFDSRWCHWNFSLT